MKDTELVRNENYEEIKPNINYLQFLVMLHLFNYRHQSQQDPTSHQLHEYMESFNIKRSFITISSRLTELRQLKLVHSYRVDGNRSTLNELTLDGYNVFLDLYQENEEFKRRMKQ